MGKNFCCVCGNKIIKAVCCACGNEFCSLSCLNDFHRVADCGDDE